MLQLLPEFLQYLLLMLHLMLQILQLLSWIPETLQLTLQMTLTAGCAFCCAKVPNIERQAMPSDVVTSAAIIAVES